MKTHPKLEACGFKSKIAYPMCGKDKLFVCKVGASVGRGVGVRAKVAEKVQDA